MLELVTVPERALQLEAAGEGQSGDRLPLLLQRVAVGAARDLHQISASLDRIGGIAGGHGRGYRLRRTANQVFHRKHDFGLRQRVLHRRRERTYTTIEARSSSDMVRNARRALAETMSTVVADAFTDGASQLVVAPSARSGSGIRRDVGSDYRSR